MPISIDLKKYFDDYIAFVKRLIPKPAQVPVIGIDVGTSAIKAVKLISNSGQVELCAWAIERIESGNIKGALKSIVTKLQITPEDITIASVSGKGTLIRYVDMPPMPLDDLRKSFVYELDKYFPFDPASIYSDCAILNVKTKDKKMPVLIVGVKKEIIDERMTLFKEAGLELYGITLNAIALANAFDQIGPASNGDAGKVKAVLDIGGSVSSLVVIGDHSPRFTRDIFIGSQEITQQIANILGIDAKSAEQIKCATQEQTPQVIEACEAAISNLISEIRLSLDYFMTEKNVTVDELYLLGGGSLFKGIEGLFERNLSLPVKIWDPLAKVKCSSAVSMTEVSQYSTQLGVALGLGIVKS